jgi:predicted dehydrogenase
LSVLWHGGCSTSPLGEFGGNINTLHRYHWIEVKDEISFGSIVVMSEKRKYVQVGLGGRHEMYRDAVTVDFAEECEMVGLCDSNEGRLRLSRDTIRENSGKDVPIYQAEEFDRMVQEQKPDCVIVTTTDCLHDKYICRAMELGCDVITEKPMTTDEEKCQNILDTKRRTGQDIKVTFNYRFSPPRTQIKELLMSGVIGEVLSVDFHWLLDVHHGADYFRRWHRNKENSGGLMVHKATHHFDLVNWWLSTVPESVYAKGHRKFYVPQTADRYGLKNRGERCHGCPEADRCPFFLDIAGNELIRALYLDNEQYDGYYRDRCVFSDQIDIEDSMNVVVGYRNGVKLTYSLNAFMPWEGYTISFNGTKGRLEHKCQESTYINADGSVPGALDKEGTWTRIYKHWQTGYDVDVWEGEGGHGGADPVLLKYLFDSTKQSEDKYMRTADERSGAWSILTGVAANRSMDEDRSVKIEELVSGLEMPEYPEMPDGTESLPIKAAEGSVRK